MLDVVFVCILGDLMKEISTGVVDTRIGKECRVMIDDKVVGSAKTDFRFCGGLALKVKMDMEKKGFKCEKSKNS